MRMVSEDTRAILGTDLTKVFAAVIAFIAVYILIPIVFPALMNAITALNPADLGTMSFAAFFGIFILVLLFFLWTIFLFFGIFKLVSSLQKKYGAQIRRSDSQEKVRVVMIIAGFFLAAVLVFNFYLIPLISTLQLFPAFDLISLLFWGFTTLSVMIAATIGTFLFIIYAFTFLSDGIFHLYRRSHNQPLSYDERPRRLRRYNHLKVFTLILIVITLVTAGIIYLVRPTVLRLEGSNVTVQYNGGAGSHIVHLQFLEIYTSTISAASWESLDALNPGSSYYYAQSPYDTTFFALYILDDVSHFDSKHYQSTIPQGRQIDGFILYLEIDGYGLSAIYYPSADHQSTRCDYLSKIIHLDSITITFTGDTPTSFTFKIGILDEFLVEDMF